MKSNCNQIAINTFQKIQDAFPHLQFNVDLHDPHVEISVTIPEQD